MTNVRASSRLVYNFCLMLLETERETNTNRLKSDAKPKERPNVKNQLSEKQL